MSTRKYEHLVWSFSDARGTELLVLLAIAGYADDAGTCRPHLETLAGRTRLTVPALTDVLLRLERKGELQRDDRGTLTITVQPKRSVEL